MICFSWRDRLLRQYAAVFVFSGCSSDIVSYELLRSQCDAPAFEPQRGYMDVDISSACSDMLAQSLGVDVYSFGEAIPLPAIVSADSNFEIFLGGAHVLFLTDVHDYSRDNVPLILQSIEHDFLNSSDADRIGVNSSDNLNEILFYYTQVNVRRIKSDENDQEDIMRASGSTIYVDTLLKSESPDFLFRESDSVFVASSLIHEIGHVSGRYRHTNCVDNELKEEGCDQDFNETYGLGAYWTYLWFHSLPDDSRYGMNCESYRYNMIQSCGSINEIGGVCELYINEYGC